MRYEFALNDEMSIDEKNKVIDEVYQLNMGSNNFTQKHSGNFFMLGEVIAYIKHEKNMSNKASLRACSIIFQWMELPSHLLAQLIKEEFESLPDLYSDGNASFLSKNREPVLKVANREREEYLKAMANVIRSDFAKLISGLLAMCCLLRSDKAVEAIVSCLLLAIVASFYARDIAKHRLSRALEEKFKHALAGNDQLRRERVENEYAVTSTLNYINTFFMQHRLARLERFILGTGTLPLTEVRWRRD